MYFTVFLIPGYIHRSGILHEARKNVLLGVKKFKIDPRAHKWNLGLKDSIIVQGFYIEQ
jgi:hypothetical protein